MFIIKFSNGEVVNTECSERKVLDYAVEVLKRGICEEAVVMNEAGWILFTVVK